jgi:catechol 2,3-dioxygenase-like lactoylglutathione lyase family enzyme
MIKLCAIDHIVLRTERYEKLIGFYCDVLGCTVERVVEKFGLTQLRAGNALIDIVDVGGELGRRGGPAPEVNGSDGRNVDHYCLQIEPFDEDELKAYLESKGVECGEFHDRYGAQGMGRSLYIEDPAGNTVELKAVDQSAHE